MTHLTPDTLWALARRELPAADDDDARAHLSGCGACRDAFADAQGAVATLTALPEPPPLPDAVARRVGAALSDELDRRAAASLRGWWAALVSPRLRLVALGAALAVVVTWALAKPTREAAQPEAPVVTALEPTPTVAPPSPEAPKTPAEKLTVTVAAARRAQASRQPVMQAQVLAEGAVVATEQGGSLWMKLPDGTRAGLTGASEVTLTTLEAQALALDVAKGSVALVVPHREDRVLTVRAGDVVVKDLGTRFLVSREPARVLVAVEEGSVEVRTPTETQTVQAGRAVTWRDGRLQWLTWAPRAEGAPAPSSTARLVEEDDEPLADEAPTAGHAGAPDEAWAAPPASPRPAQPPAQASAGAPPPMPDVRPAPVPRRRGGFNLDKLEQRLRELGRAMQAPFGGLDPAARARQAAEVERLASAGRCEAAIDEADAWLQDTNRTVDAPETRREVLLLKLRCLTLLQRSAEAAAVQAALDGR